MKKPNLVIIKYSLAQTVYQIGTVMMVAIGALAGRTIAPAPELATLPLALSVVGTLAGLFPAAQFMKLFGRRQSFVGGTGLGVFGISVIMGGLATHSFWLFCAGFFLYGLHQAFLQYLRFAAMESVEPTSRPNALSWILVAGIPAAFLGPWLGSLGSQLFPGYTYLGSYLILAGCLAVQLGIFLMTKNAVFAPSAIESAPRPLPIILKQFEVWVAIAASAIGYAMMVMLMAAVPIAMKTHGHVHGESTVILQWHVLGMYIPSFFSGFLIKWLGKKWLIILGILIMGLEAGAAMSGFEFPHFAVALVLLGIGWNFMYVGGTNLLIEQYAPAEKTKVQAFNDSIVFSLASMSTYGAGYLESQIGWFDMNLIVLPILAAVLFLAGWSVWSGRGEKVPSLR